MAEFAQTDIAAPGIMTVDWETRVYVDRLRDYRLRPDAPFPAPLR